MEAHEPAVVLDLPEERLDQLAALAVELRAALGLEDRAHEVIGATGPAGPRAGATAGVRWDQHRDPFAGELVYLFQVPVAGVGDDDLWRLGDAGRGQLGP